MGFFSSIGRGLGRVFGDITGSNAAAEAQTNAANRAAALSREQFNKLEANLAPYRKLGVNSISGLVNAAKDINPAIALRDFYNSGEYGMMSAQANSNLMAQQEALGGMGSSATANSLQRIAPMLGQQHLSQLFSRQADSFNRYMGMVNLGQNASAQTGAAGQRYASQAGQAYQQAGQAQAMGAMAPFQTIMSLGKMAASAYGMGMF